MKRKICVVSGTRADFGLLRWLMKEISESQELELQVVVTGMHLSPEYGLTYKEIEEAGFTIDSKIEMLLSSDTSSAISKSIGLGIIGFADTLEFLKPDIVLVLGDRFELIAAATAALIAGFPLAHIHGGETTEGAFDESIRHAITKMSHFHFVCADEYRRRVIQLGENPKRVFDVGGLGVEAINQTQLLNKNDLEHSLKFKLGAKSLLVTFHPVTLEGVKSSSEQLGELLLALHELVDTKIIITMPNCDTGGRALVFQLEDFAKTHPNVRVFTSLGQLRYLSCMKWVDGVVGNSSSGLIEAPALRVGTINIGERQKGRLQARSVIDCLPEKESILTAIKYLYTDDFKNVLRNVINPYGNGGSSGKIVSILEDLSLENILKKPFYDLSIPNVRGSTDD